MSLIPLRQHIRNMNGKVRLKFSVHTATPNCLTSSLMAYAITFTETKNQSVCCLSQDKKNPRMRLIANPPAAPIELEIESYKTDEKLFKPKRIQIECVKNL